VHPLPELIYHYTTTAGLLGILDSKTLWATDAEFLNDAQELRYGRDQLCVSLDDESRRLDSNPLIESVNTEVRARADMLSHAASILRRGQNNQYRDLIEETGIFVTCFCEDGDLLSQWRSYAAGGYALGFNPSVLLRRFSSLEGIQVDFVKVGYGLSAVEAMIPRVLEAVEPEPDASPLTRVFSFYQAARAAVRGLASIKHPAFQEEQEWRFIASVGDDWPIHHRIGVPAVVPYISLPMALSALESVTVGPGPDMDLRLRGVQSLLSQHKKVNPIVRSSAAPFRG
jgi:hypothetical protein